MQKGKKKGGKLKLYEPELASSSGSPSVTTTKRKKTTAASASGGGPSSSSASSSGAPMRRAKVSPEFQVDPTSLFQKHAQMDEDEQYSEDERALNEFVVQHPMLSLESTSERSLKLLAEIFKNESSYTVGTLPVVSKSYDDTMLRPPNEDLGERPCLCAHNCMCRFLAKLRYGPDTDLAFTCVEYLLPREQEAFKSGKPLPTRRKKCLLCTRYFVTFLYYKTRMNPTFALSNVPATVTPFVNYVTPGGEAAEADTNETDSTESDTTQEALEKMQRETHLCSHASLVGVQDGYHPKCLLFTDEQSFYQNQNSRDTALSPLIFQPVVRFDSSHYEFDTMPAKDRGSARIPFVRQVGIGCEPLFGQPPLDA